MRVMMTKLKVLLSLILVLGATLAATDYASATPSADFREVNGDVMDDWGISRTRAVGEDGFYQISETGFRPVIAFESLGEEVNLAYSLGEQMAEKYPDRQQRAEAIFHFVRDRVKYTPDKDQFNMTSLPRMPTSWRLPSIRTELLTVIAKIVPYYWPSCTRALATAPR